MAEVTHGLCQYSFASLIVNYFNTEVSKLFHPWVAWYISRLHSTKKTDLLNDEGYFHASIKYIYTTVLFGREGK